MASVWVLAEPVDDADPDAPYYDELASAQKVAGPIEPEDGYRLSGNLVKLFKNMGFKVEVLETADD